MRRYPYHLRKQIKDELKRLENEVIIEKVEGTKIDQQSDRGTQSKWKSQQTFPRCSFNKNCNKTRKVPNTDS